MFYCEGCAEKNGWPNEFWRPRSFGRCEMCEKPNKLCFDVPSKYLPEPKRKKKE